MANKNRNKEEQKDMGEILSKTELFFENNQKLVYGVLIAIVAIVLLFIVGKKYYIEPQNEQAAQSLVWCEKYLERDSFNLALNGDGINRGYAEIASSYKMTKAKNEAAIGAAVCCYNLGEYDRAIDFAKKVNKKSVNFYPAMQGLIGDCLVEKGDIKAAVAQFEKAAKIENEALSPRFLKKAADLYLYQLNDKAKALELYQTIKNKYFGSQQAVDIDKYIDRANSK